MGEVGTVHGDAHEDDDCVYVQFQSEFKGCPANIQKCRLGRLTKVDKYGSIPTNPEQMRINELTEGEDNMNKMKLEVAKNKVMEIFNEYVEGVLNETAVSQRKIEQTFTDVKIAVFLKRYNKKELAMGVVSQAVLKDKMTEDDREAINKAKEEAREEQTKLRSNEELKIDLAQQAVNAMLDRLVMDDFANMTDTLDDLEDILNSLTGDEKLKNGITAEHHIKFQTW